MSDNTDPYGVVLARTTNGWDRSVLDPRVAGIYQDIDVTPGSELVINFISTSPTFTDGVTGAKLKISNVEERKHYLINVLMRCKISLLVGLRLWLIFLII